MRRSYCAILLCALVVVPMPVLAASAFVKFDDKIAGESKDPAHPGWVEIKNWRWQTERAPSDESRRDSSMSGDRSQSITITKVVDSTSADLYKTCTDARHMKKVTIDVHRSDDPALHYVVFELENVYLTRYELGVLDDEDRATEEVTLNFGKVKAVLVPQKDDGSEGDPLHYEWDISKSQRP